MDMESNGYDRSFESERPSPIGREASNSSISEYNGNRRSRIVQQTHNGQTTILEYPIVTKTKKKKYSVTKPISSTISRRPTLSSTLARKAERFFGLENDADSMEQLWAERRIRMANRTYGGVRPEAATLPRPTIDSPDGATSPTYQMPATFPRISKPSVGKYVAEGLTTLSRKIANIPATDSSDALSSSRSYLPGQTGDSADPDSVLYSTRRRERGETESEIFFNKPGRIDPATGVNQEGDMFARQQSDRDRLQVGMGRIDRSKFVENIDETDKREFGIGVVGGALGRNYRKSVRSRPDVATQIDYMDDYRPYFTYWVTTVQLVIMIITVATYGFAPIGVELHQSSGHVLSRGLYIEQVDYYEPANFWIGPRPADLIHLGAKFSPCMRKDRSIEKEILLQRIKESETGCCIRNDRSGCVQIRKEECSTLLSTFHKWSLSQPGPDHRSSGPVCGQDPRHCSAPVSSYASTWWDDITTWPVCRRTNLPESDNKWGAPNAELSPAPRHMTCETVARPCCIGIHGRCEIRTKEFCDWVHGHFHPEATLCSQVACMEDVCGMLPFASANIPDQVYRLLTSLFLHAGLLHVLTTIFIQIYLMRDLEKLCGPLRMSIIYLGSGMAGNLASAIFIPYRAESGPAGSQFGILAALIVEVLNVWPALQHPGKALGKLITITTGFFVLGLLPWVDNYAHMVGFFSGFLLSYALMPYIAFDRTIHSRARRLSLIILCLLSAVLIFTVLLVVFYLTPIYECEWCKYFTCIPFTKDFCADQNINFKKDEPIIAF